MAGMFSKGQGIPGGKYLVLRRDNTVPKWPWLVLGGADEDAPAAIRYYASLCYARGRDPQYVADLLQLAAEMEEYLKENGPGDPDGARHRVDNPDVVARMIQARGA